MSRPDDYIKTPPLSPLQLTTFKIPLLTPWPPPERIAFVEGKSSLQSVMMFGGEDWPRLATPDFTKNFNITYLRRVSASKLPDNHDLDHVVRGAQYVLDESQEWQPLG